MMDLEDTQRELTTCIACGEPKDIGNVVCWDCFKYRENPWKHSELDFEDWLNQINDEGN